MVEIDAEVFLRSTTVVSGWDGGSFPSFGADAALLSHANGPLIFRDCAVGSGGTAMVLVFVEALPHGTPGREAEKPVKREGKGGGLAG